MHKYTWVDSYEQITDGSIFLKSLLLVTVAVPRDTVPKDGGAREEGCIVIVGPGKWDCQSSWVCVSQ